MMEIPEMIRVKLAFLTGIVAVTILIGCSDDGEPPPGTGEVVVYSSVDEVFARPITEQFEKETGIEARLVPDTEETKSTGLLNRLIAEKQRPVADVLERRPGACRDPQAQRRIRALSLAGGRGPARAVQ